jgi:hypothetical protein
MQARIGRKATELRMLRCITMKNTRILAADGEEVCKWRCVTSLTSAKCLRRSACLVDGIELPQIKLHKLLHSAFRG